MSIIVLDQQTKRITLYCKGADSFVARLLTAEDQASECLKTTMSQIDIYAQTGLRTLLCSKKDIP